MGKETQIAWTDHSFNIAWGCWKISPGCANCYADAFDARTGGDHWGRTAKRRTFGAKHWSQPLKWDHEAGVEGRRHRVFCSSMTDVFLDDPTIEGELPKLWRLIRETPWLDWQLLTKRPDRIARSLPANWGEGWPNVWLGASVESQEYAGRLDDLLDVPAVVHFASCEPLLGPLDLDKWLSLDNLPGNRLDWVIVGGESKGDGKFRPMDHAWARDIREQCEGRAAFFFKQSAARYTERGIELEGVGIVREFPLSAGRRNTGPCRPG